MVTNLSPRRADARRLYEELYCARGEMENRIKERPGTQGTQFARAQCSTLRLKLLKIGARLKITTWRVWLSFSQAYPYAETFNHVLANLRKQPLWHPPG